jgi:hypothetical protein
MNQATQLAQVDGCKSAWHLSCEGNDTMTVFDLETHKPVAHLPMASGADVIKFDDVLKRIYVACLSGAISIFKEDDPTHFRKVEDFPVERKVHGLHPRGSRRTGVPLPE